MSCTRISSAAAAGSWSELAAGFRKTFDFSRVGAINWFPGHMTRGLRQMEHTMLKTDLIIEVHDARIPLSGRNINFHSHVTGTGRPHVLVLNKKDLVFNKPGSSKMTLGQLEREQEELRNEIMSKDPNLADVIFTNCKDIKCSGLNSILPKTLELIKTSDRYHRSGAPDSNFMIIGIPNVGKSSLINLVRSRTLRVKGHLKVGKKPGVTRAVETKIKVSSDPLVYLLDTPGIMMPKIDSKHTGMKLACCGAISDQIVGEANIADYLLYSLNKQRRFQYVEALGLKQPTDDINVLLVALALKHGFHKTIFCVETRKQRTIPKLDDSASRFIRLFREGKLGPFNFDNVPNTEFSQRRDLKLS